LASPATLATGSLGAGILGAGLSAFGSYEGGKAQQNAYNYQAAIAQMNAKIENNNAAHAIQVGEREAQISGMQTRAQIGETKAIQSGSNLDVNKGSAVDVRASEADIGKENEMTIRSNAAWTAYGFEVKGAEDTAQANLDLMAGENAKKAGILGMYSSLLGGAGSVGGKWAEFKKQGIF
jgi:hypothetical protein